MVQQCTYIIYIKRKRYILFDTDYSGNCMSSGSDYSGLSEQVKLLILALFSGGRIYRFKKMVPDILITSLFLFSPFSPLAHQKLISG